MIKTLLCLLPLPLAALDLPQIPEVNEAMRKAIDSQEIAAAITLVAENGVTKHCGIDGVRDLDQPEKLGLDSMFWIASMTKPVTGVAVMILQEEGKLDLDDPVSKHLPEFGALKGPDGKPASITLRQCLTHTSGLPEPSAEASRDARELQGIMPSILAQPLQFPPGSRWQYCQSGINTAARVVEVVSGMSFPEFIEKRIFQPLGMKDTTFYPDEDQAARLVTSYERTADGKLVPAPLRFLEGKPVTSRDRYPRANGGLFSTASDYLAFCQMLLDGGKSKDQRLLSEASVLTFRSIHTGDLETGFTPGNGWGVGCCVVREPQGVSAALSPGSFGHGGAYGTQAWIDPVKKRIFLLMVQRANFPNSDDSPVRKEFQNAAAKALDRP
ncbi:MAG: beta-lactamase family protein [Akkermansiaceae bacterium]|jgi:CubicO group peptidase (beta-lactamase class C family)|nr:beta-lactamase family protein [Akkermansiaceae bacterium]